MIHWIVSLVEFQAYWSGTAESVVEALLKMLRETTGQETDDVIVICVSPFNSNNDSGYYKIAEVYEEKLIQLIDAGNQEALEAELLDGHYALNFRPYDFYSDVIGVEFVVGSLEEYENLNSFR